MMGQYLGIGQESALLWWQRQLPVHEAEANWVGRSQEALSITNTITNTIIFIFMVVVVVVMMDL